MKKIFILLLSVCFITSMAQTSFASDMPKTIVNSIEYTYFDDGSYALTYIIDEKTDDNSCKVYSSNATTKTKSKISKYYSSSDVALWYIQVTGTFTYGNGTSKCISSSVSADSYSSNWKVSDKSSSKSKATATAKATGKLYRNDRVIQTIPRTISLTCDSKGNFS